MKSDHNDDPFVMTKTRAKHAYEICRIKNALFSLVWVLPLTLSVYFCGKAEFSCLLGGILGLMTVGFIWRGQIWRQGTILGAMAGTIAFLLHVISHLTGLCCTYDIEFGLCVVGLGNDTSQVFRSNSWVYPMDL